MAMRRSYPPQIRGKSQTLQELQQDPHQQKGDQSRWVVISGLDRISLNVYMVAPVCNQDVRHLAQDTEVGACAAAEAKAPAANY